MPKQPALTETIASTATIRLAQLPESTFYCTPIEERFERITRIARRALDVPVAAITFLSEQKQWFVHTQRDQPGFRTTREPHSEQSRSATT